jgi:hypothetical protein
LSTSVRPVERAAASDAAWSSHPRCFESSRDRLSGLAISAAVSGQRLTFAVT